ncbi:ferredoxin [Planosporangium thailandense]|uniref:Ferredoxin n=1 Tax=Planosporangium thailandense TaxID=765197 RepID=A0ABX0Y348_9ACTN|nr:ferredoxin [Planosporangium thailandense]NJC71844.1 ferredoxin [Planosporangium thailandense]
MKVRVVEDKCQGHGLCRLSSPNLFYAREEDGHAYVKDENVPAGKEDEAQLAADSCPELAIEVD